MHGEAIAIGQVVAANISRGMIGLTPDSVERIRALFAKAGLPTGVRLDATQLDRLLNAMRSDKKVSGGEIKFVLAKRIGQVEFGQQVPTSVVIAAMEENAAV